MLTKLTAAVWGIAAFLPLMSLLSLQSLQSLQSLKSLKSLQSSRSPNTRQPNILLIQADDLGYGDLSVYGQKLFQTPVLDRLAHEGTRFTQYYSGSTVCAPSRAALMTGIHTGHNWIRGNGEIPLRAEDTTVAEVLRRAGYRTAVIGKWGLGVLGTTGQPDLKGFEHSFGFLDHRHAHRQYTDHLWRNGVRTNSDLDRDYVNDLFTQEATQFISQESPRPFFIYLNYTVPHAELRVPDESLAPFRSSFTEKPFLNEVADGRPSGSTFDARSLGYRSQQTPFAAFAGMITRMDRDIGRLAEIIRSRGIDRHTLILFTSDNGPHREGGTNPAYFNSSGGLRGIKRDLYEGGIRVPMIAWWPGTVPAGRISNQVWAHWDVHPTLAEIAGVRAASHLDGVSKARVLKGQNQAQSEFLYWEFHEGGFKQAVRMGKWKGIRFAKDAPLELYDIQNDPTEQQNIAATNPHIVARIENYLKGARTESAQWPVK